MKLMNHLLTGVASIGLMAAGATAQETGDNENIVLYQPAFFEVYNPITALDMVRQVPGFSIQDGGNARGFGGTAGNVLIDGERPSAKSTSLNEILGRIPVSRVERVELVRGAVSGLDMRGQTRVVNVVLIQGDDNSQTTWSFRATHFGERVVPTGEVIQSFKLAGADISLGLQRNGGARRNTQTREFVDAGGTLFEQRNARNQTDFREWQPHFTLARKFNNENALNLTGKYWNWTFQRNRTSEIDAVNSGTSSFDRFDFARADNSGEGFEIGGDYEFKIGERRSLKFIFLTVTRDRLSDDIFETFDTGGFANATRVLSSEGQNESIIRSVFDWEFNPKNSFEFSIEGALNSLDSGLDIEQDTGTGFQPVILPVANTRVEEQRAEAAASWVAKPRQGWTIESGVRYEISEISQSGDAANARTFQFIKPNLNITWDRNERDQVRLNIVRDVGQLNFSNFATSINVIDDQTNVGNTELRPQTSWTASLSFERKYGEKGVFILNADHNWISDVRDQVPINNQFDAPGNIGDGRTWMISAEARIPTDRIGLKDGILTLEGGFGDSTVTDPLTGLTRVQSFRVDDFYRIDFRQELTKWKMAWGFDYFQRSSSQAAFLFDQRIRSQGHGDLDIFVETTRWKGMTIRFSADNIFDPTTQRIRTRFDGPRNLGVIRDIETLRTNNDQQFTISLRGTF